MDFKNTFIPSFHKSFVCIFIIAISIISCKEKEKPYQPGADLTTKFEKSHGTETVTYKEGIEYVKMLDENFETIKLLEYPKTDSGEPLHLVVYSQNKDFNPAHLRKDGKDIIMVNNAIHPGEPDGVDASLRLLRDIAKGNALSRDMHHTVLIVIPFYNIGGALNRNSTTRVNQSGPNSYGFRGNAQNYDLNRDFIKHDSKNAGSFTTIFRKWKPDVFIDTHVSNGADYQYTLTNLVTQENKLGGNLGDYLRNKMLPELRNKMKNKHSEIIPYVNVWNAIPDSGYVQFLETPRYSTGYTALFNTIGFTTETHMLKPFRDRVEATYSFLTSVIEFVNENNHEIDELRQKRIDEVKKQTDFPIGWRVNRDEYSKMDFKGFEASSIKSEVTGQKRLFYDRNKPFKKNIKYYNKYVPSKTIKKPTAYVLPRGYNKVIEIFRNNLIEMHKVTKDTVINVTTYHIDDYKTYNSPYEGHYPHYNTTVKSESKKIKIYKGDYLVFTDQESNRFIIETLEPEAVDSFFNWNFFDTILRKKEGFSAYVFEDLAKKILEKNSGLKEKFEARKKKDSKFSKSAYQQLNYIYQNSEHYEQAYQLYPVYRVEGEISLPETWND